jgi:hypothetical protein
VRTCCILLIALALAACAETDPYKRLDPAPTGELSNQAAAEAFDERWPLQFKCVQTVTIDFRVVTRTLTAYLAVQRPGKFRLQGMTEQGLKLFDIAHADGVTTRIFAADEFDGKVLDNIVRDTVRVFLATTQSAVGAYDTSLGDFGLMFVGGHVAYDDGTGSRVALEGRHGELNLRLVGNPPYVDWYAEGASGRDLYRVDQYEWQNFGDMVAPSVIVLREPGIQSDGPAYKLTIKITELTVRDKPWSEKMFMPPEKDD